MHNQHVWISLFKGIWLTPIVLLYKFIWIRKHHVFLSSLFQNSCFYSSISSFFSSLFCYTICSWEYAVHWKPYACHSDSVFRNDHWSTVKAVSQEITSFPWQNHWSTCVLSPWQAYSCGGRAEPASGRSSCSSGPLCPAPNRAYLHLDNRGWGSVKLAFIKLVSESDIILCVEAVLEA